MAVMADLVNWAWTRPHEGEGSAEHPVADNSTERTRKNRRIDIRVVSN